jgi:hypothetical protein
VVGPHPVDELVNRDGTVGVDEERAEHTALPGVAEIERPPVGACLHFAKKPKLRDHN